MRCAIDISKLSVSDYEIKSQRSIESDWKNQIEKIYNETSLVNNSVQMYVGVFWREEMVGHGILVFHSDKWILDGLRVLNNHRNKGLGLSLIKERIKWAKKLGAKDVFVCCANDNLGIQSLIRGLGFAKDRDAGEREAPSPSSWYVKKLDK